MSAKSEGGRQPTYWFFFIAALGLTATGLYLAFFVAPVEAEMGIVQKIYYTHVSSAIGMEVLFLVCGGASIWYLVSPSDRSDRLAISTAEIGVLLATFVLISGPLWARKAWGQYWDWEPRLTLTLVVCFMYGAYLALRSFGGDDPLTRRIGAGLAIAGVPGVYLIKVAVDKWRGNHPQLQFLHPDMKIAGRVMMAGVACLAIVLVWERYRLQRARNELDELVLEMMERDLLEEDV